MFDACRTYYLYISERQATEKIPFQKARVVLGQPLLSIAFSATHAGRF